VNKFIDQHSIEKNAAPEALAQLHAMMLVIRELTGTLGLFLKEPPTGASGENEATVAKLMELVIEIRARARAAKDFPTADLVRTKLTEAGISLEDRAEGTQWSKK